MSTSPTSKAEPRRGAMVDAATEEALLAAARSWPRDGLPDDPKAWLVAVAARRLTDLLRAEQGRRPREEAGAGWTPEATSPAADQRRPAEADDTLVVLFMCCHPSLSVA